LEQKIIKEYEEYQKIQTKKGKWKNDPKKIFKTCEKKKNEEALKTLAYERRKKK
jgi:hypothetical protein